MIHFCPWSVFLVVIGYWLYESICIVILSFFIMFYLCKYFCLSLLFMSVLLFFCFKCCFVLIIVYGQTYPFCLFVSGLFIVMFWMVFSTWRLWKLSPIFLSNILCFKLSHLNVEYTGNLFSYNEWIKEKTDFFAT